MRTVVLAVLLLALTSCKTGSQRAAETAEANIAFCRSITKTEEKFLWCMYAKEMEGQQRVQAASAYQVPVVQSQPMQRPRITTCNKVGMSVVCNTM